VRPTAGPTGFVLALGLAKADRRDAERLVSCWWLVSIIAS
jgi:hypothetical protein